MVPRLPSSPQSRLRESQERLHEIFKNNPSEQVFIAKLKIRKAQKTFKHKNHQAVPCLQQSALSWLTLLTVMPKLHMDQSHP